MLVFGRNVARDLLKKNKKIEKVILQDNFDDKEIISLIENKKIRVETKSKREIDNLSNGVHQGIILFIPDYKYKELNYILDSNDNDFIVILDHLEDPHNLGAIIRTCEAAGVKSIIIPKDRQVQINATVMKTSVGTLDNVKIVLVSNLVNTIEKLKKSGYWIVGTALDNSIDYRNINYDGKIALIIGNEGSGISNLVAKKCDYLAKIPMYGITNSLNASVAAGIMIYEVIRNRK
jgi:23S rRNA (guanosine2251-2'-O)-methyltransferase